MLSYRRCATDDQNRLASILAASARSPRRRQSNPAEATMVRVVQSQRSGGDGNRQRSCLLEGEVRWNLSKHSPVSQCCIHIMVCLVYLGSKLCRHNGVLLPRRVLIIEVTLVEAKATVKNPPIVYSGRHSHPISHSKIRDPFADFLYNGGTVVSKDGRVHRVQNSMVVGLLFSGVQRRRLDFGKKLAWTGFGDIDVVDDKLALAFREKECFLLG